MSLFDFLPEIKRYRKYQIWVINTQRVCELYLWENWRLLLPALTNLIGLTGQPAFIRTFQSREYENKWLGFGRMKWNEENNIKWTTKYRQPDEVLKKIEFFNTEIWAPDWNTVCETGIAPDIFINLYNFPTVKSIREGLVITLPKSLYKKNKQSIDRMLIEIASHIPESQIHEVERDWWGRTAKRNNIEDMNPHEIKKIVDPNWSGVGIIE